MAGIDKEDFTGQIEFDDAWEFPQPWIAEERAMTHMLADKHMRNLYFSETRSTKLSPEIHITAETAAAREALDRLQRSLHPEPAPKRGNAIVGIQHLIQSHLTRPMVALWVGCVVGVVVGGYLW